MQRLVDRVQWERSRSPMDHALRQILQSRAPLDLRLTLPATDVATCSRPIRAPVQRVLRSGKRPAFPSAIAAPLFLRRARHSS